MAKVFPAHDRPTLVDWLPQSLRPQITADVTAALADDTGDEALVEQVAASLRCELIELGQRTYLDKPWIRSMEIPSGDHPAAFRMGLQAGDRIDVPYTVYRLEVASGAMYVTVGANGGPYLDPMFASLKGGAIEVRASDDDHRNRQIADIERHIEAANDILTTWNDTGLPAMVRTELARQRTADQQTAQRRAQLTGAGFAPARSTSPPQTAADNRTEPVEPASSPPPADTVASPTTDLGSDRGHAFLSYVHADAAVVDCLQRALEDAGISVWRDVQQLWGGDDWQLQIRNAITNGAIAVVAVFSSASTAKTTTYQHEELALAVGEQRLRAPGQNFIIPVRVDDCAVPSYPLRPGQTLDALQRIDLFPDFDAGAARVAESVARVLAPVSTSPSDGRPPNGPRPDGPAPDPGPSPQWFNDRQALAETVREHVGPGWFELRAFIDPVLQVTKRSLLDAARAATIHTFGWPLGIVVNGDGQPAPTGEGIAAEIRGSRPNGASYDHWELRTDGSYYLITNLFEDHRDHPDRLYLDTRIVRITEALLFLGRLYTELGAPSDAIVHAQLTHGGLTGRHLATANPNRHIAAVYRSTTAESTTSIRTRLTEIEATLTDLVHSVAAPLLELFDFFDLDRTVSDDIVTTYAAGQMP